MLHTLPAVLRGTFASLVLAANTLFWCVPLFSVTLLKICLRFAAAQRLCDGMMSVVHEGWISVNKGWMRLVGRTRWHVEGLEGLDYEHSYLVTSNHQSWVDILVLQYVLNRRIRPLKFFLKQELIWVPVIGLCWWALGFPFMKRYTKAYLDKHPEKRGKDLATTRKTCARFRGKPVGIFNFLEGTRFTPQKHAEQQSPFKHLLKPKAGGIAFVLDAMGEQLEAIIDATIHYPDGSPGFWDVLSGKIHDVVVRFETLAIPQAFIGKSYDLDSAYRLAFQQWVNALWQAKDAELSELQRSYPRRG
ncbi:acyltransferase [Pseudomonas sp. LRF_L74]|uniref:acyltransferase n=1 Tax=Pseudomonas sp. LRF_L74 TaxID=3369422 RepID=UPI003F6409EB